MTTLRKLPQTSPKASAKKRRNQGGRSARTSGMWLLRGRGPSRLLGSPAPDDLAQLVELSAFEQLCHLRGRRVDGVGQVYGHGRSIARGSVRAEPASVRRGKLRARFDVC